MLLFLMYVAAAPAQFKAGDNCQLNHALVVEIKRGKKKRNEALAKGEAIKIVEAGKKESTIEAKIGRGSVATADLAKYCQAPPTLATQQVDAIPPPLPSSEPASAPSAPPVLFVPKKTTSVTIGAVVMPPNTKKEIYDSVRNLVLDVIRTSGTLNFVEAPEQSEQEAMACVQSNACMGERAKTAGAEYAVGAWLKSEKNRGVLDFRLVDAAGKPGNATLRSINDPAEVDTETVTALKIILRGMIPEDAGILVLRVNEDGAQVKLDGAPLGKTPMIGTKVRTGAHDITLEKPRFTPTTQRVVIEPGKETFADLWLDPKADYKNEYKGRNGLLRRLAWAGVGVGIAGTVGAFALRIGANRIEDGLKNDYARLDAMYNGLPADQIPREEYAAVDRRAGLLPLMDGLTWTMGAVALVGAAAAITCFIIGEDPNRYDRKPDPTRRADAGSDIKLSLGVGAGNFTLRGEF